MQSYLSQHDTSAASNALAWCYLASILVRDVKEDLLLWTLWHSHVECVYTIVTVVLVSIVSPRNHSMTAAHNMLWIAWRDNAVHVYCKCEWRPDCLQLVLTLSFWGSGGHCCMSGNAMLPAAVTGRVLGQAPIVGAGSIVLQLQRQVSLSGLSVHRQLLAPSICCHESAYIAQQSAKLLGGRKSVRSVRLASSLTATTSSTHPSLITPLSSLDARVVDADTIHGNCSLTLALVKPPHKSSDCLWADAWDPLQLPTCSFCGKGFAQANYSMMLALICLLSLQV